MFRFNLRQAIEAVAILLSTNEDFMRCSRLKKILYLCEREGLEQAALSITGDDFIVEEDGPYPSIISGLIHRASDEYPSQGSLVSWRHYFKTEGRGNLQKVLLKKMPRIDKTCLFSEDILKDLGVKWCRADFDLLEAQVKSLPEYQEVWQPSQKITSFPLSHETILTAVGRGSDIERIRSFLKEVYEMRDLLNPEEE